MEEWVHRALKRWPNVPALFGWLRLDRRGRWLIKGEYISRPQIIDVINRNYASDDQGRWYFQNGPQRGYMQLDYAPLVLHTTDGGTALQTHTGLRVEKPSAAFMDEEGAILLVTEHGPGAIVDDDLEWALERLRCEEQPLTESQLESTLGLPSGVRTELCLLVNEIALPVVRLDSVLAPEQLGFERDPAP
ncbi:MAG: DUF2946 family protein [Candidatus Obscuribacterales bacterium]|nr:DUF2946 family protein [Steroidobacteraceae bacterium]